MCGLGNWVDNWTLYAQSDPDFTDNLHSCLHHASLISLDFKLLTSPSGFVHLFAYSLRCISLFIYFNQSMTSLPYLRSFFFFFVIKVFGMVQCFVFLRFLPPLMNFGSVITIPVDIRVLGVEHP